MCCLSLALLSICETAGSKLAHTLILSNFATSLFAFPTLFGICLAAEYKKRRCCSVPKEYHAQNMNSGVYFPFFLPLLPLTSMLLGVISTKERPI